MEVRGEGGGGGGLLMELGNEYDLDGFVLGGRLSQTCFIQSFIVSHKRQQFPKDIVLFRKIPYLDKYE